MNAQAEARPPDGEQPEGPAPRNLRAELDAALKACTPKQRRWLKKIPLCEFQPWRAAKELSYSSATVAKWMREDRIKAVRKLQDEIDIEDMDISRRRILREFSNIAFMRERYAYDPQGLLLPPQELPDYAGAAVAERSYDANGNPKLKFHDKNKALEFLARFNGMDGPTKLELTGKNGAPLQAQGPPIIQFIERVDEDDADKN